MSNDNGADGKSIAIPLYGFSYVHAPYDDNINPRVDLFAGRDAVINRLVSLLESNQKRGSYLIAGYRGVGKTSVVNRSIEIFKNPDIFWKRYGRENTSQCKSSIVIKINLGDNSNLMPLDIYFSIASFLYHQ